MSDCRIDPAIQYGAVTAKEVQLAYTLAECQRELAAANADIRKLDLWATEAQARAIQCEELLEKAQADLAAANARCEEYRKDAERYRWIKAKAERGGCIENGVPVLFWMVNLSLTNGRSPFDAAIDDAREGK